MSSDADIATSTIYTIGEARGVGVCIGSALPCAGNLRIEFSYRSSSPLDAFLSSL
jgi:hypothetical protein